eukprot:TRINITY_DN88172_c0_g1_i1.p1 TRINITY_DN88172_c0_g1~~TRINITY_DN88172_c0_g1_i1.p1  ORF type:complete len:555 (+),score=59.31 TRINITY_DN88172_c0_g1_i1:7-1671(+)
MAQGHDPNGDYFDLPKEKFDNMSWSERMDHFTKRVMLHGLERPSIVYYWHFAILAVSYSVYVVLMLLVPRPVDLSWAGYAELMFVKLIVWQHFAEAVGCRQGPLGGHVALPNNWKYRLTPGTFKCSQIPWLGGNKRNALDILVHAIFFVACIGFVVSPWYNYSCIRILCACDVYLFLFDLTQFFASTGHAYGSMLFSACFPASAGRLAGMQLGLIYEWFFSGVGKIGPWFGYVNGPFMIQSRWLRGQRWLFKLLVKSEEALTPTLLGIVLAHTAAAVEYVAPVCLMMPSNTAIWLGLTLITAMHVYILAMPAPFDVYSWNLCFGLSGIYLFYIGSFGFDFQSAATMNPWLIAYMVTEFVVCWYGQFFPDQIGYYISHRYWAGNWVQCFFFTKKTEAVKQKLDRVKTLSANPLSAERPPYYYECLGYISTAYLWLANMNMKCTARLFEDTFSMHANGTKATMDDYNGFGLQSWCCGEFRDQLYAPQMLPAFQQEIGFEEGECLMVRIGAFGMWRHSATWSIYDLKKGCVSHGTITTRQMEEIDSCPSKAMELLLA